ncbi:thioredoxin-disulfide reductase [archaeon]|nr:thioredoxin-disulfide reductase [Nanoarchaeota archaeon]MBU4300922.1 thioredoxin-disulfide reductase [Nanoarchaeota archaeon]MCG2723268.1 thioredoxin-disulfide reductase [archaeon]
MLYDLIVIGGGPAGMTAALYARRYDLKVLVLYEKLGGHTADAHNVENYPGILAISGMNLAAKFKEHAEKFKAEIKQEKVERIEKATHGFHVTTYNHTHTGKTILIATGTETKSLEIKGEKEFSGRGVSFCATCDGPLFKNKTVAVVGGGDSAASAALYLSDITKKVYLIHRREEFRAEPMQVKHIKKSKNIECVLNSVIQEIKGAKLVSSAIISDVNTNKTKEIALDGVFIEIGAMPTSVLVQGIGVKFDNIGFIIVDAAQSTNVSGVYAAGDITTGSNKFMQIVTAAAEGAVAASSIYKYVRQNEKEGKNHHEAQWAKEKK